MAEQKCPICETGELRGSTYSRELVHKGVKVLVADLEYMICKSCNADPVFADQSRRNMSREADAKREAEGLLTSEEIRQIRQQLNLSQAQASEMFGGGRMAFSKYERGANLQSVAMDRLLRVARDCPDVVRHLNQYHANIGEGLTEVNSADKR